MATQRQQQFNNIVRQKVGQVNSLPSTPSLKGNGGGNSPFWSWVWDGQKWNQKFNSGTGTRGGMTVQGAPSPGPAPTTPGTTIGEIAGSREFDSSSREPIVVGQQPPKGPQYTGPMLANPDWSPPEWKGPGDPMYSDPEQGWKSGQQPPKGQQPQLTFEEWRKTPDGQKTRTADMVKGPGGTPIGRHRQAYNNYINSLAPRRPIGPFPEQPVRKPGVPLQPERPIGTFPKQPINKPGLPIQEGDRGNPSINPPRTDKPFMPNINYGGETKKQQYPNVSRTGLNQVAKQNVSNVVKNISQNNIVAAPKTTTASATNVSTPVSTSVQRYNNKGWGTNKRNKKNKWSLY